MLTASDATQYAFEGDTLAGRAAPSIFTASLAHGLQTGAADVDADGLVSVDDVYEYAPRRLADQPHRQSPRKWEFDVAGTIVLARSPVSARPASDPAGRSAGLPVILPPDFAPAVSAAATRSRQAQKWLGALLFLATAVALSLLLAQWTLALLSQAVNASYLPTESAVLLAAGLAGATWALAYVAVDAARDTPTRWYDLHVRWLSTLGEVFRPSGVWQFLRAVRAAVPLNVALTLLASIGITASAYQYAGGSQGRDRVFPFAFALLTALGLAAHIAGGQRHHGP